MTELTVRVFYVERAGQLYSVWAVTRAEAENVVAEGHGRLVTCSK